MTDFHNDGAARDIVTLLLDTSAVLAYAAGSMHVHEPVLVATENSEGVGVPVTCLIEAGRRDPHADLNSLLLHPQIVVIAPDPTDADLLLDWTLYYNGRADCAAAAVASYRRATCLVLTAEPQVYAIGGRVPAWVIPIDGNDPAGGWDVADLPE